FALTNTVAEMVSVSVEVSGEELGSFAAVTFIEPLLVAGWAFAALTAAPGGYAGHAAASRSVARRGGDGVTVRGLAADDFQMGGVSSAQVTGFSDQGDGIYTFQVTNTVSEAVSVSVEVLGVALGSFAAVTFIEPLLVTSSALAAWTEGQGGYPGQLSAS